MNWSRWPNKRVHGARIYSYKKYVKLAKGALGLVERRPRRNPAGAAPGTIQIYPDARQPKLNFVGITPDECFEAELTTLDELPALMEQWPIHWLDVDGVGSEEVIRKLGEIFGVHPLVLEDIAHTHQRAKLEEFDTYLYYVARMVSPDGDGFQMEQVSLLIFENSLITFQEKPGDCLEVVRERLRLGRGRIRKQKADYLAYAIIDAMVDAYFPLLEKLGDSLEELELEVLDRPTKDAMERVHAIRRELFTLRRALWPQREAISALMRPDTIISKDTQVYLRDCYDHTIQLVDLTENYRELSAATMDLYLSGLSQKLNEVMKVLAIISTIFLPLSFIAGVYGMNFSGSPYNMPELTWTFGYLGALGLMAMVALSFIVAFKKLGWL